MPTESEVADKLVERKAAMDEAGERKRLYEETAEKVLEKREPEWTDAQRAVLDEIDAAFGRNPGLRADPEALGLFEDIILEHTPITRSEAKQCKDYFKGQLDWTSLGKQRSTRGSNTGAAADEVIRSRKHALRTKGR